MSLEGISTDSILDYLRKERNIAIFTLGSTDVLPLFGRYGFVPTRGQVSSFIRFMDKEGLKPSLTINFIKWVGYYSYKCDIRLKEDDAKTKTVTFCELEHNKKIMTDRYFDKIFFHYTSKVDARLLRGVEENGLDFYIDRVYNGK